MMMGGLRELMRGESSLLGLGSLLEAGAKSEVTKLEEDLMSTRLKEVEAMGELKELRLKVRHLTQQKIFDNS